MSTLTVPTQVSPEVYRWRTGPLTPTIRLVSVLVTELMDGPGERNGVYCEPLVDGELCGEAVAQVAARTGVEPELVWAAYGRRP